MNARPDFNRHGDRIITADATKVSPAEFLNAVFPGPTRAERYAEYVEGCIRLIECGGSLYGKPPGMVEDAIRLMAERERLTTCEGDPMERRA